MGNSAPKLADTLFEMRFAAKQLERESRKREKAEAEQKKKVAQVSGLVPLMMNLPLLFVSTLTPFLYLYHSSFPSDSFFLSESKARGSRQRSYLRGERDTREEHGTEVPANVQSSTDGGESPGVDAEDEHGV